MSELFDLSGRVALITGSSQGLGRATAQVLAEHGAHVIISSRKQADCEAVAAELVAAGLKASVKACNIGHEAAITEMYEHVAAEHGRLDILVNNAVLSPWRSIAETDRGLFMKAMEVNMAGYWFMAAEAAKLMQQNGGGAIVNISSLAARRPTKMLGLYATFKSALDGMTQSFALEYGPLGIRVNTILPGLFRTSLADAFTPEEQRKAEEGAPLGRLGEPEEIGHAVLFLVSDASAYITGTSLIVDGGRMLSK